MDSDRLCSRLWQALIAVLTAGLFMAALYSGAFPR